MRMATERKDRIFVGVKGQEMDNSTLAKIVVNEMAAAEVDFRATPNRLCHSTVTIVSYHNNSMNR